MDDKEYCHIIACCKHYFQPSSTRKPRASDKHLGDKYIFENGTLKTKAITLIDNGEKMEIPGGKVVVPQSMREMAFFISHVSITGHEKVPHFSSKYTHRVAHEIFYWKDMKQDIDAFLQRCCECKNKTPTGDCYNSKPADVNLDDVVDSETARRIRTSVNMQTATMEQSCIKEEMDKVPPEVRNPEESDMDSELGLYVAREKLETVEPNLFPRSALAYNVDHVNLAVYFCVYNLHFEDLLELSEDEKSRRDSVYLELVPYIHDIELFTAETLKASGVVFSSLATIDEESEEDETIQHVEETKVEQLVAAEKVVAACKITKDDEEPSEEALVATISEKAGDSKSGVDESKTVTDTVAPQAEAIVSEPNKALTYGEPTEPVATSEAGAHGIAEERSDAAPSTSRKKKSKSKKKRRSGAESQLEDEPSMPSGAADAIGAGVRSMEDVFNCYVVPHLQFDKGNNQLPGMNMNEIKSRIEKSKVSVLYKEHCDNNWKFINAILERNYKETEILHKFFCCSFSSPTFSDQEVPELFLAITECYSFWTTVRPIPVISRRAGYQYVTKFFAKVPEESTIYVPASNLNLKAALDFELKQTVKMVADECFEVYLRNTVNFQRLLKFEKLLSDPRVDIQVESMFNRTHEHHPSRKTPEELINAAFGYKQKEGAVKK